jgi:hypothetical protein
LFFADVGGYNFPRVSVNCIFEREGASKLESIELLDASARESLKRFEGFERHISHLSQSHHSLLI